MGAWGEGMLANDTALDAVGWFQRYNDDGKPYLTAKGKRVVKKGEILKALEWVYKKEMTGRFASQNAADTMVLGVANFFLDEGVDLAPARKLILESIKRQLSQKELSCWCDPKARQDALLRFKDIVEGKPLDKGGMAKDNEGLMSKICRTLEGQSS